MHKLLVLTSILALSGPALAQQAKPGSPASGTEPVIATTVNLNVTSDKVPFCFWSSAIYSPGSHLDAFDSIKKAMVCFHCNADGSWDSPCQ